MSSTKIMRIFFSLYIRVVQKLRCFKLESKNITVGKGFSCGKSFRCETINNYHAQTFQPKLIFGDRVHIEDFVHIGCTNNIEIGSDTVIASKVYITDHNHGYYDLQNKNLHEDPTLIPPLERLLTSDSSVLIGKNVWIGESVTILPGSIIGDGAIIGANSVVCGNLPPMTISVGSPARVIKKFESNKGFWVNINEN